MITEKMENLIRDAIDASVMSASELEGVLINCIYIVNTNQSYDGFWGKNGYNNMVVVGYSPNNKKYYILSEAQCDIVRLWRTNAIEISIDIPEDLNCIRLFGFTKPLSILNITSSVVLTSQEEYEKEMKE